MAVLILGIFFVALIGGCIALMGHQINKYGSWVKVQEANKARSAAKKAHVH